MGFKPCFPFRFERQFHQRLGRSIVLDGNTKRAFVQRAWFGYPEAARWVGGCVQVHGGDQVEPLRGCQVFDPIDPGCPFSSIFLGHLPHREAFRAPGRGE